MSTTPFYFALIPLINYYLHFACYKAPQYFFQFRYFLNQFNSGHNIFPLPPPGGLLLLNYEICIGRFVNLFELKYSQIGK